MTYRAQLTVWLTLSRLEAANRTHRARAVRQALRTGRAALARGLTRGLRETTGDTQRALCLTLVAELANGTLSAAEISGVSREKPSVTLPVRQRCVRIADNTTRLQQTQVEISQESKWHKSK